MAEGQSEEDEEESEELSGNREELWRERRRGVYVEGRWLERRECYSICETAGRLSVDAAESGERGHIPFAKEATYRGSCGVERKTRGTEKSVRISNECESRHG